jgi:hypothetical protein
MADACARRLQHDDGAGGGSDDEREDDGTDPHALTAHFLNH